MGPGRINARYALIKMIKLGLKLWSVNNDLFCSAVKLYEKNKFDFIELYVVPDSFDDQKLSIIQNIPITIHCPHFMHDFNLMKDNPKNFRIFKEVKKFADFFKSRYIIIHPGIGKDFLIFRKNVEALSCIKINQRIIFENMPFRALTGEICYGHTINHIKKIKKMGYGLCLDFGHAVKAAKSQAIDSKEFIKKLIKLDPVMFHISDGFSNTEKDEHMGLGLGDYDLKFMKSLIQQSDHAWVVMETQKKVNSLDYDLKNMEYFRNIK